MSNIPIDLISRSGLYCLTRNTTFFYFNNISLYSEHFVKEAAVKLRKENLDITVLTYNTHLFKGSIVEFVDNFLRLFDRGRNPLVFDDNIRSRHIVSRIKECGADIVALEEVWAYARKKWFARELKGIYPFHYYPHENWFDLRSTCGLVLLSKWRLANMKFTKFRDLHGDDAWSKKGIIMATVEDCPASSCMFRVGVSHAGTDTGGAGQPNIRQIAEEIEAEGGPAIVMGDFNVHKSNYDAMNNIFNHTGATDAFREVHKNHVNGEETIDLQENRLNRIFSPKADPNDRGEGNFDRIDFVYVKKSGTGLKLLPRDAYVIHDWKYESERGLMDLSDHYPLVVKFSCDLDANETASGTDENTD